MKRQDVIKYFWEELEAYTLGNHRFQDGFKQLVNASIERAIIRSQNKGKTIPEIERHDIRQQNTVRLCGVCFSKTKRR